MKIQEITINPLDEMVSWIKTGINKIFSVDIDLMNELELEIPPSHIGSDYAVSLFILSKVIKKDPSYIASSVSEYCSSVSLNFVKRIYAVGPYINVELDKELYSTKVVEHILRLGGSYGFSHQKKSELVLINYFGNDARAALMGQAIAKAYEWCGYEVNNYASSIDREDLALIGQEVIADALKYGVAEYIGNTNAIVTLTTNEALPLVLQKHDRSLTKNVFYLADHKQITAVKKPYAFIYFSTNDHAGTIESLVNAARRLQYISAETATLIILTNESNLDELKFEQNKELQYAVLRVTNNKSVVLDEASFLAYSQIFNIIQLSQEQEITSGQEVFNLVQLLAAFPLAIANVCKTQKIDKLCAYLEKVANLFEKTTESKDKFSSKASSIVLENGLKLLLP